MSLGYPSRASRVRAFGFVALRWGVVLWCFAALGSQPTLAQSWKRIGTVTTLTNGQLCKNDGTNIICDSTTPTISSGNVGIGSTTPGATLTLTGTEALNLGSDYTTTGLQSDVAINTASAFRYNGAGTATFYGIVAGVSGQVLILHNASASTLTISNQSGSEATAANKIITGTGADLPVPTNTSVVLQYDGGASRWRIIGSSIAGVTTLSGLTPAIATNTIDNGTFAQTWTWNTLAGNNALSLTSTSTAAASNAQTMLNIVLSGTNGTSAQTTYGEYISNTHAGTTSMDIGLYATASGGTTQNTAIEGATSGTNAADSGIYGIASGASGATHGVFGRSDSATDGASGVFGYAGGATGATYGVFGQTVSTTGGAKGVYGYAGGATGATHGVEGQTVSTTGGAMGVYGYASGATGATYGVYGLNSSATGYAGYFNQTSTGYAAAFMGGNVGIGTTTPTNILSFGGNAAQTVWMERGTVAATAGYALTLQAGGATSGATDKAGGDLVLSSGTSTGMSTSKITFKTFPAGSTGTADGTATTAMTILGAGNVGIGTTNPGVLLDVYGNDAGGTGAQIRGQLVVKTNSANLAQLQLVNTAASGHTWTMGNVWGAAEWGLRDFTAAGTPYRFLIDGSGNVGIGNTAPGSLLDVGKAGTTLGTLRLEGNTSGYVQIQPAAAAGSWTATLPATAGTSGQQLTTDGTGVLLWAAAGGASLDGITAAVGNQAGIANGAYTIVWNWDTLAGGSALKLASTSTAAAGNTQTMLQIALSGTNGTAAQATYGLDVSNTHAGTTSTNFGIRGTANNGTASNYGVYGTTASTGSNSYGLFGYASGATGVTVGVYGYDHSATGYGGYFSNDNGGYAAAFMGGNVGIGTTTPGDPLHVYTSGLYPARFEGTNSIASSVEFKNGSNVWELAVSGSYIGAGKMYFYDQTAGAPRFTIDTSGNVGIGTTSPGYKLDVNGDINFSAASAIKTNGINILRYTGGNIMLSATGGGVGLSQDSTNYNLFVVTSGNVGIGTTVPGAKLDIAAGGTHDILFGVDSGGPTYSAISFNGVLTDSGDLGIVGGGDSSLYLQMPTGGSLVVRPNGAIGTANAANLVTFSGTQSTFMNGSVGIGSTTPGAALTVTGTEALNLGSDYTTTGLQSDVAISTASAFRYNGAGTATFYGIVAGTAGQVLILHNASASVLTISNQSGSEATAANKIITGTGADLAMSAGTSATMQYDGTAARWRITGGSGSNSGTTLNNISAATGSQAGIANAANTIVWNWDTLAGGSALKLGSISTAAAGNAQKMFEIALSGTNGTSAQSTYDIYVANTHAGTTSTNYGIYATASGGTTNNYGIEGATSGTNTGDAGVYGSATGGSGLTLGVYGQTQSTTNFARGVQGLASGATGTTQGVEGSTNSTTANAVGVEGDANAVTGATFGVYGYNPSTTAGAAGVNGNAAGASGATYGVYGTDASATGFGVYGTNTASGGVGVYGVANSGAATGVYGSTSSTTNSATAVSAAATGATGRSNGVYAYTNSTTDNSVGVYGEALGASGIVIGLKGDTTSTTDTAAGVLGSANGASGQTYGVYGSTGSATGYGVFARNFASGGTSVRGYVHTGAGTGVDGDTDSTTAAATGVQGSANGATGATYGVYGSDSSATGYAGYFQNWNGGYAAAFMGGNVGIGTTIAGAMLTLAGTEALNLGSDYTTTGAQNNVSLGTVSAVRYNGAGTATFTGIVAGSNISGQMLVLHNASASTLTLSNQSASSTAANRIITGTVADLSVPTNTAVVLQYDGTASRWRVISGSGANSGGLYAGLISATPTAASTGLSTWVNQSTATVSDASNGIQLVQATGSGGDNINLRCKTAPSTPYSVIGLVSLASAKGSITWAGLGWRNTTNGKIEALVEYSNNGIYVNGYSYVSATSYNGGTFSGPPASPLVWLKLKNDGTNMTEYYSVDGVAWQSLFTETLASSYLGSTGYNQICLVVDDVSAGGVIVTLLSYQETSP